MPQKEMREKPRIERDGCRASTTRAQNLSMQLTELNAEDRRVYETWRLNIILLWGCIVSTVVLVCTVLAWKQ